jgi:YVTN family beta-propeller protein
MRSLHRITASGVCLVVSCLGASAHASAPPAEDYRVFVTNERSGDITVIDGRTWRVIDTVPLGKRPRGVHASRDGQRLFVALSGTPIAGAPEARNAGPAGEADADADGIGILDTRTLDPLGAIRVGTDPEEFALLADGQHCVVSNEDAGTASVVRIADGAVERTVPVGAEPEGVAVSPDGERVWVTCETRGEVMVLDAATAAVTARLEVGGRPRSVAFLPDGSRAYVPSETSGQLHVFDGRGRPITTVQLPEGARPMKVIVSPDGRTVMVSTGRGGTIDLFDARTLVPRGRITVGTRPWGIGCSPDGRFLYVANGPSNDVSIVDIGAAREIARVRAGDGPWGIAVVEMPPEAPGLNARAVSGQ